MRNIIEIDVRTQCACDAVVTCGTKTNEIIIELNVGAVTSPQLEIYVGDTLTKTINLTASTTNTIALGEEYWNLGSYSKIRYKDSNRTGVMFTINFPSVINDITVSKSSNTVFTVKSYVNTTKGLTVDDIVNDLLSTDIDKMLSACQGNVLDGKIADTNESVTNVSNKVNGVIDDNNNISANSITAAAGTYVSDMGDVGWGYEGYIVLARMEITSAWIINADIEFDIQCNNNSGKVLFRYNNPSVVTDTRVTWFTADYPLPNMYYTLTVGTNSVTIDLIAQKSAYNILRILNIRTTHIVQYRTIFTYPNTFESTLRDGAVQATPKDNYTSYVNAYNDVFARYGSDKQASLSTLWDMVTWFGPYLLEDIDNTRQGIGINIIDSILYISFTFGWIALQFAVTPGYVSKRYYYGNNGWSSWEVV